MSWTAIRLPFDNERAFRRARVHSMQMWMPVRTDELTGWLETLSKDDYYIKYHYSAQYAEFYFADPSHAMLFKLAWSNV